MSPSNPPYPKPPSDPIPPDFPRGVRLLHDPVRNKGMAFSAAEREALGLRGLLPPRVLTEDLQVRRAMENLARKPDDLEKYIFLNGLQDRNETLFYRVLTSHLPALMPIVYTPTVGQVCQAYGHIFRRPRGMFVSADDRGSVADVLANWPHRDVRIIVVTDGERILGLGDLGAHGMGIPVGKLALYTACAGIPPTQCLPITLDVGTENPALLDDPLYVGLARRRLRGAPYDELVDELMQAATARWPRVVVQLEDFGNRNAFDLLERYRDRYCVFNDDIQGTGSVVLAGLLAAERLTGVPLPRQRFLFLGAGEAGIGIAHMIGAALVERGVPAADADGQCWFFDSRGLVVRARDDLTAHKRRYAQDHPPVRDFLAAVQALRPTAIIGVSGAARAFGQAVVEAMAAAHDRPLVLALSNPTSRSECTAAEAYGWSGGRAVFASGSPFDPVVTADGRRLEPGQGNNAYIFPGVGLGVIASRARHVTDEMFLVAAKILAGEVTDADLAAGRLYPPLDRIRDVSARIAVGVAEVAFTRGLAAAPRPADVPAAIRAAMFEPIYPRYA